MKYFKTDGIRGVFKRDDLSIDLILRVGLAMNVFKEKKVLLSYDTRYSSNIIRELLKYSIRLSGCDVIDIGLGSTPYLMYNSKKHKLPGIMITASHNDFTYNGLKVVYNGLKIDRFYQEEIEKIIDSEPQRSIKIGNYIKKSYLKDYTRFLDKIRCNKDIKVGFDLANGSLSFLLDYLKKRFNNALFVAYKPNGININESSGSQHPDTIRKFVLDNKCDIGFSFDGDGDRIIVCDKDGKIYNGDMVLAYFALALKKENKLKCDTIVCTKIFNQGIAEYLVKHGIKIRYVDVGDSNITKEVLDFGGIGGEKSGHLVLNEKYCYSDAIVSALRIIELYQKYSFSFLNDIIPYYEKNINLYNIDKPNIVERHLKEILKNGNVVIRKSGTENVFRVLLMSRIEAEVEEAFKKLNDFIE